ncbi:MAG TPA: aminoglycoside phosphotransferase [Sulfurimonas autotrophica]|uniref:Aminoglycoside phosphotransferase n=1 Tax=Sulfurimonas autotrophica TaxID=202747 RepID=A0A7C3G360_9BACT|nr:aminoglycoside phosphotransferase [Sulfurimonas autotrophica]
MQQIKKFLATTPYSEYALTIASADASFRKYYRLTQGEKSFLLMDSSLEKESLKPFLDVTERLEQVGVAVPKIYEQNLELGYLIIEDFGNTHLLNVLNENNFKELYKKAIDEIITMQKADAKGLPLYDKDFLHFEMDLMQEWYIEKHLARSLTQEQKELLADSLNAISNTVLTQPQGIFVHRDYHSRNIMLREDDSLGIIDYQDAMSGALLYDLVSLLKDCYIAFDRKSIIELVLYFKERSGVDVSDAKFIKWFDFMGMQRHIKVLGIFARLSLRDGKDGYLKDIPLTLAYTLDAAKRYEETKPLAKLLEELTK